MESAAPAAATYQDGVKAASSKIGMGAIHMRGHDGLIPLPSRKSPAEAKMASTAKTAGCLWTKPIKISPEGTLVKSTKFFLTLRHATATVEHNQSMRESAELNSDLYR